MHVAAQDIGLRLKNGAFEVRRTLRRGQWGVAEDDAGRIYRNTNESALHVDLVPAAYFARKPTSILRFSTLPHTVRLRHGPRRPRVARLSRRADPRDYGRAQNSDELTSSWLMELAARWAEDIIAG